MRPKCVLIQYHCLMYHDMTIYRYIVASLVYPIANCHIDNFCVLKTKALSCNSIAMYVFLSVMIFMHIYSNRSGT